jgi:tRNA(Ile)-lysidine synthase
MIHMMHKLPKQIAVACSGGSDSMAMLDFLRRCHDVQVVHVNHHTHHAQIAEQCVSEYCARHGLPLQVHGISSIKPKAESWEEFWRNQRYQVFHKLHMCVVSAHHLDDAVETYLFNCMHGKSHTIAYKNQNVVRPFLITPKQEFTSWCMRKHVPHVEDPSNQDVRFMRNLIRHQIMPLALKVNPGLRTVVRKIIQAQENPI